MEASSVADLKPAAVVANPSAAKANESLMSPAANMPTASAVSPEEEEEEEQEPVEEEEEQLVFLGSVKFTIVGIRYYTGEAHPGEFVSLAREPRNPYDRNAIRVDNMSGQKVGHIKREQAAALAPILDNASLEVKVDGLIPYPGNQWNLPVTLEFYGREVSLSLQVARLLKGHRIGLQGAPISDTSSSSGAAAARPSVVVQKKTIDWKTQQKHLDDMFDEQSKTQLSNLPQMEMPAALKLELFDYQKDGVRWMCHRETGNIQPPFYKQVKEGGKTVWLSEITNASQPTPPKSVAGGILADEMGLGKTMQAVTLILANPPEGRDYNAPKSAKPVAQKLPGKTALSKLKAPVLTRILEDAGINPLPSTKGKMVDAAMEGFKSGTITLQQYCRSTEAPKTTLIVCPVSVMSNWTMQIKDHVVEDTLRVETYHGPNRHELLHELNDIDVLIASYNTISYDFSSQDKSNKTKDEKEPTAKKRKQTSPLFDARFHRIVLDEAHTIRSSKTRMFRACTSLDADRKFCLTGTPLTNRPDDIQSLFSFLGVEPLGDRDIFRRAVSQPIQAGDQVGLARLRAMMSHITLRRSKALAQVPLPEKVVEIRSVTFPADSKDKAIHDALFQTAQVAFKATLQGGDAEALKNYMSVLETLLRIRQACCSGVLVPKERLERAEQVLAELQGRDGKALTAEEGKALLDKLKGAFEEQDVECSICLCEMEEKHAVILRSCSHVFCQTCIARVATTAAHSSCPLCRVPFSTKDMIEKNAASKAAETSDDVVPLSQSTEDLGPSPKIQALLNALGEMKPDEKGVIFSYFTSFLDEIEKHLDANDFTYARIDGKKTAAQRSDAMEAFASENDGPKLMLCSLHAAGCGINLTAANHCFMMSPWWNSSSENQAMDRIHRLGQMKDVRVIRFVMKQSIEERMIALQDSKAAIAKGSMEKLKPDEVRKARIGDLKSLFDLSTDESK